MTVYLDGHPLPCTPFGVKVGPATLHAPACAVKGLAEACPHGMLEFEVHGRDAFGNSLQLLPRYTPRVLLVTGGLNPGICSHVSVIQESVQPDPLACWEIRG